MPPISVPQYTVLSSRSPATQARKNIGSDQHALLVRFKSTLPLSPWLLDWCTTLHKNTLLPKVFSLFSYTWMRHWLLPVFKLYETGRIHVSPGGWSPSLSILSLRLTHGSVSNYGSSVPLSLCDTSMYEDIRFLINAYLGNVHLNKQRVGTDLHPPRHLAWLTITGA